MSLGLSYIFLTYVLVVVEKPFTRTSEEADRVIALAKEKKRILTVFQSEWIPSTRGQELTFSYIDDGTETFRLYNNSSGRIPLGISPR
jgi:Oxidoreductase family, NAD-binding Rossmann fold